MHNASTNWLGLLLLPVLLLFKLELLLLLLLLLLLKEKLVTESEDACLSVVGWAIPPVFAVGVVIENAIDDDEADDDVVVAVAGVEDWELTRWAKTTGIVPCFTHSTR